MSEGQATKEKTAGTGVPATSTAGVANVNVVVHAVLPRDLPYDAEEYVISIICESDRLKWNLHDGKHKFAPTVFWV
ncbi:MAG: hypothetical protein ACI90V_007015 [Bacillariaceae sp.]|jgi:hypothetical protein